MRYAILLACFLVSLTNTGCGLFGGKTEEEKKADEYKLIESKVRSSIITELQFKQRETEEFQARAMEVIKAREAEAEARAKIRAEDLVKVEKSLETRMKTIAHGQLESLIKQDDVITKLKKDLEKQRAELNQEREVFEKKKKNEEEKTKAKLAIADEAIELIKLKSAPLHTPSERRELIDKLNRIEQRIVKLVMDMIK